VVLTSSFEIFVNNSLLVMSRLKLNDVKGNMAEDLRYIFKKKA